MNSYRLYRVISSYGYYCFSQDCNPDYKLAWVVVLVSFSVYIKLVVFPKSVLVFPNCFTCLARTGVLLQYGIDVKVFKPHSTRAACTSKAHSCQVPLDIILQAASWKIDCTLRKFYSKTIQGNVSQFSQAILGLSPGE